SWLVENSKGRKMDKELIIRKINLLVLPLLIRLHCYGLSGSVTTASVGCRSSNLKPHLRGRLEVLLEMSEFFKKEDTICAVIDTDYRYVILSLIGAGGFGEVYRVKRMNKLPDETNTFALKTETIDENRKHLNRLKIEMTVLQLCNKLPPYRREHFIMLADKGSIIERLLIAINVTKELHQ
uniref:Protein kinase domain-containing protein n=1 Tax=Parascaris univalens TaxID=6257 RepID=A0A915CBW5_PARUN